MKIVPGKKGDELVVTVRQAKALVKELKPQLQGMVVGEFPMYEKLCAKLGIDSGFVN